MNCNVAEDLKVIREILNISQEEIAEYLGVNKLTILRIENKENNPSEELMNKIYNFAYSKGIKLNHIKKMFYQEEAKENERIVFHGAKKELIGELSSSFSREKNDFGKGFYCGESYEQSVSFIARFPNSCLYMISFKDSGLRMSKFDVNQEWMLAVAYYRGTLEQFKDHPLIKKIIKKVESSDYIYAPIADNRMFTIIDQFIDGLITDEQCKHCLAATNLGKQYVFLNDKAISQLQILERCYISELERDYYQKIKEADINDGDNKVKAAMIKYKKEGKYIEEILK